MDAQEKHSEKLFYNIVRLRGITFLRVRFLSQQAYGRCTHRVNK